MERIIKQKYYNLDVIIFVGYRVKSKRGIEFRQWASKILKQYMIDGYAINEKRLHALQKTVDIQTRMLADALNVEEKDVLGVEKEEGKVNGIISAIYQSAFGEDSSGFHNLTIG